MHHPNVKLLGLSLEDLYFLRPLTSPLCYILKFKLFTDIVIVYKINLYSSYKIHALYTYWLLFDRPHPAKCT